MSMMFVQCCAVPFHPWLCTLTKQNNNWNICPLLPFNPFSTLTSTDHVNRTVTLVPLKGLGWLGEKFLHISLPQLLDDGLHLSNQRMDAFVTNISEKPLTWWMKMDKLITGASLKGTYHMGVWFPKRQEVGAKWKHPQKKLGNELDCFNSSIVIRQSTQDPLFSGRCVLSIFTSAAKFLLSSSEMKHEPKGLAAKFRANFLTITSNLKVIRMFKIRLMFAKIFHQLLWQHLKSILDIICIL